MGMSDSFYDEDSKCPKCNAKITTDWQTKRLESLMESWHKGDFVQYRKLEAIPEKERKRKYGDRKIAPVFRTTKKYVNDAPLLFNGKVPVHTFCKKCDAWLEAYARVVAGRFTGIVEIAADGEEKELVIMGPETTAKSLREEFASRLSQLQESCKHRKTKWMNLEWAPGHVSDRGCVCLRCERVLETASELGPDNPKLRSLLKTSRRLRENG